jgi:hypothetical protein
MASCHTVVLPGAVVAISAAVAVLSAAFLVRCVLAVNAVCICVAGTGLLVYLCCRYLFTCC